MITFTGPGGETHRTTSSADGGYGASPPAGTYAVTVERDGFLTARRGGVELPEEGVLELVDVTLLAGDVNGDGKVDARDLAISGKNAGKDASLWE